MTFTSSVPLADLMDDFATTTMAQLIHVYSLQKIGDKEEMIQWCEAIASTSYVLAGAMMNARSTLHEAIANDSQEKESNAA